MVSIISTEAREKARSNVKVLEKNLQQLREKQANLFNAKNLRNIKNRTDLLKKQQLRKELSQNSKKTNISLQKNRRYSALPTRAELLDYQRNLIKQARKAVQKGIATAHLPSDVRKIVKNYRSEIAKIKKQTLQNATVPQTISFKNNVTRLTNPRQLNQSVSTNLKNITNSRTSPKPFSQKIKSLIFGR